MRQLFRLLIFLIQHYMFWATNSPILRSTFWLYIQLLVPVPHRGTGQQQCRCIVPKAVYTVKKLLLRMGEFMAKNMYSWIKKINKRKSCCILLVVYIIVQKFIFFTNSRSIQSTAMLYPYNKLSRNYSVIMMMNILKILMLYHKSY